MPGVDALMAERLHSCKGREEGSCFVIVRISGSAHYLRHPITGRFTSIQKIVVGQAGQTIEEWNRL